MTTAFAPGGGPAAGAPRAARLPFVALKPFLITFGIQLLVVALNWNHQSEQGIYRKSILAIVEYYRTGRPPGTTTFPLWGYPAVIAVLQSPLLLLVFQSLLSALALTMLYQRLRAEFPQRPVLVGALVFGALPWYALQSVKWPIALAHSFVLMSVLVLERAVVERRWRLAALAGLSLGLAINIRSEFLPFPALLLGVAGLLWIVRRRRPAMLPLREVGIYAAVAWLLIVPWGLWYRSQTGVVRFTSSNGGFVAFMSLGQLPGNPWGIVHDDDWTMAYLQQTEFAGRHPFIEPTDAFLRERFAAAVREHPGAFVKKVVHNIYSVYFGGFYSGEPRISPEQDVALDILKEKVKLKLRINPNLPDIEMYRADGRWTSLEPSAATLLAFGYLLAMSVLTIAFIWLSTAGLFLSIRRLDEPLFLLSALAVFLQIVVVIGLIQYQPRHVNTIYPYLALFFANGWVLLDPWRRLASRWRPAPAAHSRPSS